MDDKKKKKSKNKSKKSKLDSVDEQFLLLRTKLTKKGFKSITTTELRNSFILIPSKKQSKSFAKLFKKRKKQFTIYEYINLFVTCLENAESEIVIEFLRKTALELCLLLVILSDPKIKNEYLRYKGLKIGIKVFCDVCYYLDNFKNFDDLIREEKRKNFSIVSDYTGFKFKGGNNFKNNFLDRNLLSVKDTFASLFHILIGYEKRGFEKIKPKKNVDNHRPFLIFIENLKKFASVNSSLNENHEGFNNRGRIKLFEILKSEISESLKKHKKRLNRENFPLNKSITLTIKIRKWFSFLKNLMFINMLKKVELKLPSFLISYNGRHDNFPDFLNLFEELFLNCLKLKYFNLLTFQLTEELCTELMDLFLKNKKFLDQMFHSNYSLLLFSFFRKIFLKRKSELFRNEKKTMKHIFRKNDEEDSNLDSYLTSSERLFNTNKPFKDERGKEEDSYKIFQNKICEFYIKIIERGGYHLGDMIDVKKERNKEKIFCLMAKAGIFETFYEFLDTDICDELILSTLKEYKSQVYQAEGNKDRRQLFNSLYGVFDCSEKSCSCVVGRFLKVIFKESLKTDHETVKKIFQRYLDLLRILKVQFLEEISHCLKKGFIQYFQSTLNQNFMTIIKMSIIIKRLSDSKELETNDELNFKAVINDSGDFTEQPRMNEKFQVDSNMIINEEDEPESGSFNEVKFKQEEMRRSLSAEHKNLTKSDITFATEESTEFVSDLGRKTLADDYEFSRKASKEFILSDRQRRLSGVGKSPNFITKVPVFSNNLKLNEKEINFTQELGEPVLALMNKIQGIDGYIGSESYSIGFKWENIKEKHTKNLLQKFQERCQIKMLYFRSYMIDTLAKFLFDVSEDPRSAYLFMELNKYIRQLHLLRGKKIHSFYFGFVVTRLNALTDFFNFKRKFPLNFWLQIDFYLLGIGVKHEEPRLKIPNCQKKRMLSLCFKYLTMQLPLDDLDFDFLISQILIAIRVVDIIHSGLEGSKIFVPLIFQLVVFCFKNFEKISSNGKFLEKIFRLYQLDKQLLSIEILDFENEMKKFFIKLLLRCTDCLRAVCHYYPNLRIKAWAHSDFWILAKFGKSKIQQGLKKKLKLRFFYEIYEYFAQDGFLIGIFAQVKNLILSSKRSKSSNLTSYHLASDYLSFLMKIITKKRNKTFTVKVVFMIIDHMNLKKEKKHLINLQLKFLRMVICGDLNPIDSKDMLYTLIKKIEDLIIISIHSIQTRTLMMILRFIIEILLSSKTENPPYEKLNNLVIKLNELDFKKYEEVMKDFLYFVLSIDGLNRNFGDKRIRKDTEIDEEDAPRMSKIKSLRDILHRNFKGKKLNDPVAHLKIESEIENFKIEWIIKIKSLENYIDTHGIKSKRELFFKLTKNIKKDDSKDYDTMVYYDENGIIVTFTEILEENSVLVVKRERSCKSTFLLKNNTKSLYKSKTKLRYLKSEKCEKFDFVEKGEEVLKNLAVNFQSHPEIFGWSDHTDELDINKIDYYNIPNRCSLIKYFPEAIKKAFKMKKKDDRQKKKNTPEKSEKMDSLVTSLMLDLGLLYPNTLQTTREKSKKYLMRTNHSSPKFNQIYNNLSLIDQAQNINHYRVGILYCKPGQKKCENLMCNEMKDCSENFKTFVKKLNNTNPDSQGMKKAYYGLEELVYHIGPCIPKRSQGSFWVKRKVGNDPILIVWSRNLYNLEIKDISFEFNVETILIEELDSGILRVKFYFRNENLKVFPNFDGALMDLDELMRLLPLHLVYSQREIAPSLFSALVDEYNSISPSFKSRLKKIRRFFDCFRDDMNEVDVEFLIDVFFRRGCFRDTGEDKEEDNLDF